MNIYQIISIVLGTCCAFLGIIIIMKNKINKINLLFIINCFLLALVLFFYSNTWWTENKKILFDINIANIALVMMIYSTHLHFLIELTEHKAPAFLKVFIYIPAIAILYASIYLDVTLSNFVWRKDHWFAFPTYGGGGLPSYFYLFFFCFLYPLLYIILLVNWPKTFKLKRNYKQASILISAYFIFFTTGFTADLIIYKFDMLIPPLGPLLSMAYIFGAFYCLIKYRFLTFDITSLTYEIMKEIDDFVILLDTAGKIIFSDVRFKERVSGQLNIIFLDITSDDGALSVNFNKILEGKISKFKGKHFFLKKGERIYVQTSFSRIIDKFGDAAGILVVSKEISDAKKFMHAYKITERQFEIINFVLHGMSNNEISDKLSLTRRTVESHLFRIYYKLSIKNKIELLKLAKEFNLI